MDIEAKDYELKAIKEWASDDDTRPHLCAVYKYTSDGGCTYFATNGHIGLVRRSGTHKTMPYADIAKLPHDQTTTPPPWPNVIDPCIGKPHKDSHYEKRSINPGYFAMLATLEKVAGKRAAEDYQPQCGDSEKNTRLNRARLKESATTNIAIPSGPLDGWKFRMETDAALWTGVIMPRRP